MALESRNVVAKAAGERSGSGLRIGQIYSDAGGWRDTLFQSWAISWLKPAGLDSEKYWRGLPRLAAVCRSLPRFAADRCGQNQGRGRHEPGADPAIFLPRQGYFKRNKRNKRN